nr:hypothetical protein [Tanacetum cinerariifolium]
MDKGVADTVQDHKRKHDDDDEDNDDEDPPAGPNQVKQTKRRRTKDSKSSKKPSTTKETPKGKAPFKGSKTSKSALAKEQVEESIAEVVMDDARDDVVHDDDQPQDASEPKSTKTLNLDWFKQPPRSPTPDLEWNKQQGEGCKLWHRSQRNKLSKHNAYSTKKISWVKSVSVKKLHRYGHLEEIMVKRADRQFYKFKEGDLVDLHLNDIEDMLLLAIKHKLFHLTDIDIVDFIVALRMFTRSLVIQKRVEDLQLGVESYQKKRNITLTQ